jgi:hypothetical protein
MSQNLDMGHWTGKLRDSSTPMGNDNLFMRLPLVYKDGE